MVCIGFSSPQFGGELFLSFLNETDRGGPEVIETPFSSTVETLTLKMSFNGTTPLYDSADEMIFYLNCTMKNESS